MPTSRLVIPGHLACARMFPRWSLRRGQEKIAIEIYLIAKWGFAALARHRAYKARARWTWWDR